MKFNLIEVQKTTMNQSHRGYYKVAYMTVIALVLVTLGIEYFQYQRHEQLILTDLKNRLDEHTINVNLRARAVQGHVNGLKLAAENSLSYLITHYTQYDFGGMIARK